MSEDQKLSKAQMLVCVTVMIVAVCTVACVALLRMPASRTERARIEPAQPEVVVQAKQPAQKEETACNHEAPKAQERPRLRRKHLPRGRSRKADRQPLTEQEMFSKLAAAQDNEDFAAAEEVFAQAAVSANREVRMALVGAMSWFGVQSLPRLGALLSDADHEVRRCALFQWQTLLDEIPDDERRARAIDNAIAAVSDKDMAAMITGERKGLAKHAGTTGGVAE